MQLRLTEMGEGLLDEAAYAIYRQCMYRPTRPSYEQMIRGLIRDGAHIFACMADQTLVGLIVLKPMGGAKAEIMGIAVRRDLQKKGIGRFMVHEAAGQMRLRRIAAETDDDAVGFYRRSGFDTVRTVRYWPNGAAVRYQCDLRLPVN